VTAVDAIGGRGRTDLRRLPFRYLLVAAIVPIVLLTGLGLFVLARVPATKANSACVCEACATRAV